MLDYQARESLQRVSSEAQSRAATWARCADGMSRFTATAIALTERPSAPAACGSHVPARTQARTRAAEQAHAEITSCPTHGNRALHDCASEYARVVAQLARQRVGRISGSACKARGASWCLHQYGVHSVPWAEILQATAAAIANLEQQLASALADGSKLERQLASALADAASSAAKIEARRPHPAPVCSVLVDDCFPRRHTRRSPSCATLQTVRDSARPI